MKYLSAPILTWLGEMLVKLVMGGLDSIKKYLADKKREEEQKKAVDEYHKAIETKAPTEERRKKFEDLFNSIS